MNVTKIGSFSAEEIEALKQAGNILGSLVKAMDASEINDVDEETMQLIKAIADVADRAYSKTWRGQ